MIGITGATGFLGSYLLQYLLKNSDFSISALSRSPVISDNERINWITGDLASEYTCQEFVEKSDIIIHLAHTNSPISSDNDVYSDSSLNLLPTLNLLNVIKKSGKKIHIIYPSSGGAIYGVSKDRIPFNETMLPLPTSSYGIQKLAIENYLRLWANKGYIKSTVLRITNPYGVILPSSRKQGLIGVVLNKIIENKPVEIFGNPDNIRDYIHLEDLCKAIMLSFNIKKSFDIFNIGSSQGHSVKQIIELISIFLDMEIIIKNISLNNSENLVDWVIVDNLKARENLNWQPEISMEDGLKSLCSLVKTRINYGNE